MSYDMWFWSQFEDCCLAPGDVLDRLDTGQELQGLSKLDFDAIKEKLKFKFPEFNGQIFAQGTLYFTLDVYPPFVFQVISHPITTEAESNMLNSVIDIALEFKCALYDPQEGTRYQQGK